MNKLCAVIFIIGAALTISGCIQMILDRQHQNQRDAKCIPCVCTLKE